MNDVSIGRERKRGERETNQKKNRPSPLLFQLPLPPTDPSSPKEQENLAIFGI